VERFDGTVSGDECGSPAVEHAGLAPLRFHDLRHTAGGLMIAQNVHPKVIQSRLGHGSIKVTLDTYGHLLPSLDEDVADNLEAALLAAASEILATHVLHGHSDLNTRSVERRARKRP
jgi:integrase-like protein